MQLLRLIELLKREPWQSLRSMAERLGISRRRIDMLVLELELTKRKGADPQTGRRCLVFAIELPKSKRKALA